MGRSRPMNRESRVLRLSQRFGEFLPTLMPAAAHERRMLNNEVLNFGEIGKRPVCCRERTKSPISLTDARERCDRGLLRPSCPHIGENARSPRNRAPGLDASDVRCPVHS
jgi:hypothetical protein